MISCTSFAVITFDNWVIKTCTVEAVTRWGTEGSEGAGSRLLVIQFVYKTKGQVSLYHSCDDQKLYSSKDQWFLSNPLPRPVRKLK